MQAFVLGVAVAAPLGPVGATVLRTGLLRGFAPALAIGIGAAAVDGVYFLTAAAGADQAFRTAWLGVPLWLGGTAFLTYLAFSGLLSPTPMRQEGASVPYSLRLGFGHGLLITLLNPLTIASWLAAGSLAVSAEETRALLAAAAFIMAGTAAWFAFLAAGVTLSRQLLGGSFLRWATAAASVLILAFAVRFLIQGLDQYVL